ncbi:MAG: hypothetical protein JXD18_03815 [Anaerolineae bacterium]|nr:hypothetical protein [Anaerolineae bacterium]
MKKYPTSPFPTTLHIESKFIDQALNAPPLEATRGTEDVDDTIQTLMFIDAMMTEEGNLISEVVLHRSLDRPDEADIEVKITSD